MEARTNTTAAIEGGCQAETLGMLVGALRTWDVDADAVLASASVLQEQVDDPDARISLVQFRQVWDRALETTGDAALGLHVIGEFDPWKTLSTLVYLASSSATGREAFKRVSPFMRMAHSAIDVSLSEAGGQTLCKVGFKGWENDRTLNEYFLGLVLKIAPGIVGADSSIAAWFTHPAPDYAKEYKAILGVDVRFDAPFTAVVGPAADLDQPLPHADAILCSLLERQAVEALARMPQGSSFADRVKEAIEAGLPLGEATADGIAISLGLSGRTLRRRLEERGTTYQRLLDGVRCELARQALAEPGASVSEVAYTLGFSDTSAFHKAFRRWTGKRPSDLRVDPKPPA